MVNYEALIKIKFTTNIAHNCKNKQIRKKIAKNIRFTHISVRVLNNIVFCLSACGNIQ